MGIAIVGCGFVADLYLKALPIHPELELMGVLDRDEDRASRFGQFHSVPVYGSLDELLSDRRVEIVLNLTNPSAHFELSKTCIEAGKHVYSEKPLALDLTEAEKLVELADDRGLQISSAPCSLLSETAQTIWKALRENRVGSVYVVYAEMDDGLVHRMPYKKWLSESGIPWPYKDELEIGCTLEHAGYLLTWLPAFFGPAQTVTAFSSVQIPDKHTDVPLSVDAADFSVACIKFASGVAARLTCSIIAPHDHSLRVIGEDGVLSTNDSWNYRSPVYLRRWLTIRRRMITSPWRTKVPLQGADNPLVRYRGASRMDFCRGVAELWAAVRARRASRLSARFSLHVTELALAIHNATENGGSYTVRSSFDPIDPMPWAKK